MNHFSGTNWQTDNQRYVAIYNELRRRADKIRELRHERALQTAESAGLGSVRTCYAHLHNCGNGESKFWRNLNFDKIKQARKIDSSQFDAYRIIDRYMRKLHDELIALYYPR